ncbi:MAG: adenylate kinase [Acidobacteria bacterium]|nr:adenylate kinase [Acidobacteriota bacterium]
MSRVIVMLGPPGCGKGTQAKKLASHLNVPHISTGDMLREAVARGGELGVKAKASMDAGVLVADRVVDAIVQERVAQADACNGYVLDGYPRTMKQAEFLQRILDKHDLVSFNIQVEDEELVRRLSGRRTCTAAGHIFHLQFNPSTRGNVCDKDGSPLIQRPDDGEEVVRKRLSVYYKDTAPLVEHFRSRPRFHQIAGNRSPEEIFKELQSIVDQE